ncbi:MAG: 3-phosphoshikimate 1-carboxyvinyltransferase [Cryomorphaceae bacterium]|nr:MAG: 3-phosphoshikimate 1-carboxyvinyltransferase [Cryomorphaceae bacterium]|tara:strand:- start:2834 stop:4006 length:1173 start_codon:yes stop_codon:yes gene_type:complete
MNYKISHPTNVVECEIDLPASKSISNRLIIIQALCKEKFSITNLSNSEDTKSLQKALKDTTNTIDIGDAGTSFRFLTAYLSSLVGSRFILTGSNRMKERPIKELVDALLKLGVEIKYLDKIGFPPLAISGSDIKENKVTIDGKISSQFISALLLIAPTLKNGIKLKISSKIVSKPYIIMTLKLMGEFGIFHTWQENTIEIKPQKYIAKDYDIEADWSAASFWYEIAALSRSCNIILNGLSKNSIQGDRKVIELFKNLGVQTKFKNGSTILTKKKENIISKEINLINTPDLYQPFKCTLFSKNLTTKFLGLQTLKNKETNRIKAVEKELLKLNTTKKITTYKDHRMAMSFAPLCLKYDTLQINDVDVVNKSYPNFWNDFKKGGFIIKPLTH